MAARSRLQRVRRIEALIANGNSLARACAIEGLSERSYKAWVVLEHARSTKTRSDERSTAYAGKGLPSITEVPVPLASIEAPAYGAAETGAPVPLAPVEAPASGAAETGASVPLAPVEAPASGAAETGAPGPLASIEAPASGAAETGASVPLAPVEAPASEGVKTGAPVLTKSVASRQGKWRSVVLAACLVAGPCIAIAAASFLVQSAKTATDNSLARNDASLTRLQQKNIISEAAIDALQKDVRRSLLGLQQRNTASEAAIDNLRRDVSASVIVLQQKDIIFKANAEGLRKDVDSSRGHISTLAADISTMGTDLAARVVTLQQAASKISDALGELENRLIERQRSSFGAEIGGLRRDLAVYRDDLVQLRAKLTDGLQSAQASEMSLGQRQTDLADQMRMLREEISSSQASLSRLEERVATIIQAKSEKSGSAAALETASITPKGPAFAVEGQTSPIAPGGADSAIPPGAPTSRSIARLPATVVVLPAIIRPTVVQKKSGRSTAAARKRSLRALRVDSKTDAANVINHAVARRKASSKYPLEAVGSTSSRSRGVATGPMNAILPQSVAFNGSGRFNAAALDGNRGAQLVVVRWCARQPCRW